MSGGVDSTMSALFLKEDGYEVEGVYMRLHNKPNYHEIHQARAKEAADYIGVKLHILSLEELFMQKVVDPFVKSYESGLTPNPCALCNRSLKFGQMVDFADKIGADYVATGHYIQSDGKYLYKASDDTKDQSYFLFNIQASIVPRLIFPLAKRSKDDIKELASSISALKSFATQSESSEICFVDGVYTDVLKEYVDVDMPGEVLNSNLEVVGEHKGYMHYTVGKRRGFSVNGAHEPHYVLKTIPKTNQIIVGKRDELSCNRVVLRDLNMFETKDKYRATVKLRYRTKAVECDVVIDDNRAFVELHESVFGVACGQAGVFYDGDRLIGGGWIESTN